MYKLFTDKTELFECSITLEGANITKSKARLVLESKDINLLFKGEIDEDGKCLVPIKKLKGLLEENSTGTIRLEVIADDTYFTPWESDFEVDASKKITVEVKSTNKEPIKSITPKVIVEEVKNESKKEVIKPISKKVYNIKEHAVILHKLIEKQNINLFNINEIENKNKVNKIVSSYLKKYTIEENKKDEIILEIIQKML